MSERLREESRSPAGFDTVVTLSAGRHSAGLQAADAHSEGVHSSRPAGPRPVCLRRHWNR